MENNQSGIKSPVLTSSSKTLALFISGIIFLKFFYFEPIPILLCLITAVVLLFFFSKRRSAGNIFATAVIFLPGMFAFSVQTYTGLPPSIPEKILNTTVKIEGRLIDEPNYNGKNTSFNINCLSIIYDGESHNLKGKIKCILIDKKLLIFENSKILLQGKILRQRTVPGSDVKQSFSGKKPYNESYILICGSDSPNPYIFAEGTPFFGKLNKYFSNLIDSYDFCGEGGLLKAILFGDKNYLSGKTVSDFTVSGIAHLLAVSGLNVGIILITLNFILGFFPLKKTLKFVISIFLTVIYAGICGFEPPVTRAVIMALMVSAGLILQKRRNIESIIFSSMLIILVLDPGALFGASLQLSFAAVWGLTVFSPPAIKKVRKIFPFRGHSAVIIIYIIDTVILSFIAFVSTAPVIAFHFGKLPVMSVFTNIPAVPIAFLITIIGIVNVFFIALGSFFEPLAGLLSIFTGVLLNMLSYTAGFFSQIPFASIQTGNLSVFTGLCFFMFLFALSKSKERASFTKALIYIPLLYFLVYTWNPVFSYGFNAKKQGDVFFFDVGQGDSSLLQYGSNLNFLIDTGILSQTKNSVLPGLKNLGITKLDGIFITHTDSDHAGGIDFLIKNFNVERIFCSEDLSDSLKNIFGNKVIGISAGDSISLGNTNGILIISPIRNRSIWEKAGIKGDNNGSLVIRANIFETRILFTGDIENEVQKLMVFWGKALKSDILKMPHHGSKNHYDYFVKKAAPETALISCGINNKYGHPAQSTLSLLSENGIKILRTDLDGTIRIDFPGKKISTLR